MSTPTATPAPKPGSRLLARARGEIGTEETWRDGHWTNEVKYTAGQPWSGQPWCLWFIVWCARRSGLPAAILPQTGSCGALHRWAAAHRRLTTDPHPGDVVLFRHGTTGSAAVHCGVLESIDHHRQLVTTIDGNTNKDGGPEGYAVLRMTRPAGRVLAYVAVTA